MAEAVYILCALTSVLCAILLIRRWQVTRLRLLFWASLCFVGLALDNVAVVADFVLTPASVDLFWWRIPPAVAGMAVLIYGLVRESK
ncbi:MAG TPA: DUF5985 family protein [Steroidobacteraceae bacterium]|nr:DUF5985 family protein [Steroidobacteraceae bacterium]